MNKYILNGNIMGRRRKRSPLIRKIIATIISSLFGAFLGYIYVTAAKEIPLHETHITIIHNTPWTLMQRTPRIVTGYTSSIDETDSTPFITADGTDLRIAPQVCASNNYSFNTLLYIEDLGFCTVHDRMAKKNTEKVDWYFTSRKDAMEWGKRVRTIIKVK